MAARASLMGRAVLALVLLVGFYVLALAIAGALLGLIYVMVVHANRVPVKLLVVCVLGAGVILWSILPRWDRFEPPGPELTPRDQPKLFDELQGIAQSVGQTMPREVYLVPDVNAWVMQRGGILGLGSRRVMGLGLPLMEALTRSQFRAVLAHEFGHYHGGDTALGPLIYRTRSAIGRTLASLGDEGILHLPFLWYGKLFLRVTHAISRRQEYVADALAAQTVGARPLIDGLRTVHAAALAFPAYYQGEVVPVLQAGYRPGLAEGFGRFLRTEMHRDVSNRIIETELAEGKVDPYDTHPPLRERIAALRDLPDTPAPQPDPAASTLLNDLPDVELCWMVGAFGNEVRELKPLAWDATGPAVYEPQWRGLARDFGPALEGRTWEELPGLLRQPDEVVQRVRALRPDLAERPVEDLRKFIPALATACLQVALLDRGWTLRCGPGEPISFSRETETVETGIEIARLEKGETTDEEWSRRCHAWEIDGDPIAPAPAAS